MFVNQEIRISYGIARIKADQLKNVFNFFVGFTKPHGN